jgi:hypothetical protein
MSMLVRNETHNHLSNNQRRLSATIIARCIAVISIMASSGSLIVGADGNLDQLRSWNGKYPSDSPKDKFFSLPEIKRPLQALLTKQDYKLLTQEYGVEAPIKVIGDYLCAKDCRPHNCGSENAAFAINLHSGSINVMMFESDDQGQQHVRWFDSKEKHTTLPPPVQNFLTNFGAE